MQEKKPKLETWKCVYSRTEYVFTMESLTVVTWCSSLKKIQTTVWCHSAARACMPRCALDIFRIFARKPMPIPLFMLSIKFSLLAPDMASYYYFAFSRKLRVVVVYFFGHFLWTHARNLVVLRLVGITLNKYNIRQFCHPTLANVPSSGTKLNKI